MPENRLLHVGLAFKKKRFDEFIARGIFTESTGLQASWIDLDSTALQWPTVDVLLHKVSKFIRKSWASTSVRLKLVLSLFKYLSNHWGYAHQSLSELGRIGEIGTRYLIQYHFSVIVIWVSQNRSSERASQNVAVCVWGLWHLCG